MHTERRNLFHQPQVVKGRGIEFDSGSVARGANARTGREIRHQIPTTVLAAGPIGTVQEIDEPAVRRRPGMSTRPPLLVNASMAVRVILLTICGGAGVDPAIRLIVACR